MSTPTARKMWACNGEWGEGVQLAALMKFALPFSGKKMMLDRDRARLLELQWRLGLVNRAVKHWLVAEDGAEGDNDSD